MKRAVFIGFAIILNLMWGQPSSAVDLDAPVEKKVTVRSEIKRGSSSMFDCALNTPHYGLSGGTTIDCLSRVLHDAEYKNTDTEPFKLGAYFQAWIDMDYKAEGGEPRLSKDPKMVEIYREQDKLNKSATRRYYKEMEMIQAQLNITDETLCNITGMKYEKVQLIFDRWHKKSTADESLPNTEEHKRPK